MKKSNRHRPVIGVSDAKFIEAPAFTRGKRPRGSKRAGHLYEGKVQEDLRTIFGDRVLSNAWLEFGDLGYGIRMCSPDILVIDPVLGWITIVECKLTHTANAYRQLKEVYLPVIKKMFPGYKVRGIEVCKYIEAGTPYPVTPHIVTNWSNPFEGMGNVMVWKN